MKKPITRLGYSLMLGMSLTLAVLWLAGGRLTVARAGGPWFVATTGNDADDCLSEGSACLTIGGAVGKAVSGDVIHIAAGTYPENVTITGKALTLLGAGADFTIVDGGGVGRVLASDSDLSVAELTLQNGLAASGDGGGLYTTAAVTLTNVNVFSSTAFFNGGGVYAGGPAVFVGGLLQGNAADQGGGAFLAGALTLTDTHFFTNTAATWGGGARVVLPASVSGGEFQYNNAGSGGGLYAESALTLETTVFLSNTANDFGGGTYFGDTATVGFNFFVFNLAGTGGGAHFDGAATLDGSIFYLNTADDGGGGAYFNAVAALTNTAFYLNSANTGAFGGGATFAFTATLNGGTFFSNTAHFAGGGAYFDDQVTIADTAFIGNIATTNRGGGAYFDGPATLAGTTFTDNQTPADRGAGAYFRGAASLRDTEFAGNLTPNRGAGAYFFGAATVTYSRFLTNTAGVHGGGAYFNDAFELENTVFINNTAQTGSGGGAFQAGVGNGRIVNGLFTRNSAGDVGADLLLGSTGAVALLHTTLANSSVNPGAAIFVNAGSVGVTNTVFANYAAGLVITAGVTAASDYNLFFNAPTNVITGSHSLTNTDPLFVNPAADNYHLNVGSPAAGAGLDVGIYSDLDGVQRGSVPSIGAYDLPLFWLTVTTAGTGQGMVTQTPNQANYAQGTVVTLTAIADSGSTFAGWSGDAGGLTNPLTVTVMSNMHITATFNLNPPEADLSISLEGVPSLAPAGALVTYTLVVTNTGPATANTVMLTDTLSADSTFQMLASPAGWSCVTPSVGTTGSVACAASSLAAGEAAIFMLTVRLSNVLAAAALVTNTATVTSAQYDPTTPNVATTTTTVFTHRTYFLMILR